MRIIILALLLCLSGLTATAADLTGRVVGVSDGDTLTLLVPDGASFKQVKVRLGEIDAPESGQPYGQRAKQALSDFAFNQQARAWCRIPTATVEPLGGCSWAAWT